jgi:prevent-host-death family protein
MGLFSGLNLVLSLPMILGMRAIKVAEDIVPVGEFKGQAARWLRHAAETGQPVVITQNGKPAGVLVSPTEYDRLTERERFLESVALGLGDAKAGRTMDSKELLRRLGERRSAGRQP